MWGILDWYFDLFGFSLRQGLIFCIVPLLIDIPRSVGKIILVPIIKYKERKRAEMEGDEPIEDRALPSISIIIPAHNEQSKIERSIKTIIESRYPKDKKEVIIVDDASTDNTYGIALPYARKGQIKLFKRDVPTGAKGRAVNYGLLYAKNDIVLVVDADTQYGVNSLYELVKPFKDENVSAVAGNVHITNRSNLISLCQAYEYDLAMELGKRAQYLFGTVLIASGAFGGFRRKYVKALGDYDTDTITEDFDTSLKMLKRHRIVYAPKAIAWTICPTTWKAWWRQRIRWSRGELECFIKHKDLFFRPRYGFISMANIPDMFFIDVLLLFIRLIYVGYLFLGIPFMYGFCTGLACIWFYTKAMLMILGLYAVMELFSMLPLLTKETLKRDLIYIPLTPFVAIIYRPIYAVARLKSYFDCLLKREAHW